MVQNVATTQCGAVGMLPDGLVSSAAASIEQTCHAFDACVNYTEAASRSMSRCTHAMSTMSLGEGCPAPCVEYAMAVAPNNVCSQDNLQAMAAAIPSLDVSASVQMLDEETSMWQQMVSGVCDTGCMTEAVPRMATLMSACTSGLTPD